MSIPIYVAHYMPTGWNSLLLGESEIYGYVTDKNAVTIYLVNKRTDEMLLLKADFSQILMQTSRRVTNPTKVSRQSLGDIMKDFSLHKKGRLLKLVHIKS